MTKAPSNADRRRNDRSQSARWNAWGSKLSLGIHPLTAHPQNGIQQATEAISPATMQQGAGAVLQAMNHEAVHVAQSCKAGGVGTAGKALGIGTSGAAAEALQHEVYESVSREEKQLELEAYTLTNQAGAGINAAVDHCST